MDKQIEALARNCVTCQASRHSPPVALLQPWSFPDRPWSRFHMDYAGPIDNHMLLVVVDAFRNGLTFSSKVWIISYYY